MNAKRTLSGRSLKSDLRRVDAHKIAAKEYQDLPELTREMLARAKINRGGRPLSQNPRKLISLPDANGRKRKRGEWIETC